MPVLWLYVFGRCIPGVLPCPPNSVLQGLHSLICPVTYGVHFDPWVKVVSARCLRCKVSRSPFVISKYFVGGTLKFYNYAVHPPVLLSVSVGTPGFRLSGRLILHRCHCSL